MSKWSAKMVKQFPKECMLYAKLLLSTLFGVKLEDVKESTKQKGKRNKKRYIRSSPGSRGSKKKRSK
jgi:uncharacterized membrane protein YeiB